MLASKGNQSLKASLMRARCWAIDANRSGVRLVVVALKKAKALLDELTAQTIRQRRSIKQESPMLINRLAFILLLSIAMQLLGRSSGCADEVVKIAYLAPLSGSNALAFEEGLKIFRAAAEAANARESGRSGKRIEIVPFDNKGTVQDTLIVFRQAVDQDIHYVAATISSVANALSEAVLKHNTRNPQQAVLYLNYDARDPKLTEEACHFWHFRFEPHADMQVRVLTAAAVSQPEVKKIFFLNPDYAWGHAVQKSAREELREKRPDVEIVGDDLVPLARVKDFAPYVTKIKASGADSVLTGNWGADLTLFVKAAHEQGLRARLFTTHAWVLGTPAAIGSSGENLVRTMTAWHINAGPSEWQSKMVRYAKQYNTVSHMDFLPIWQTVDMFARALALTGSSDPVKIAYALEGMEYEAPGGRSWLRKEDHQLMAPIYIATFTKAGSPAVEYDEEGTGFGWRTDQIVEANDTVPPVRCRMERPDK